PLFRLTHIRARFILVRINNCRDNGYVLIELPGILREILISRSDMSGVSAHPTVSALIRAQKNCIVEVEHDPGIVPHQSACKENPPVAQVTIDENYIKVFRASHIQPSAPSLPQFSNSVMDGPQYPGW